MYRLHDSLRSVQENPLRIILLLDRHGTEPGMRPASPAEAVQIIGSTTLPFSPAAGPDLLPRLAQVARQVPVRRLTLHRSAAAVAQQIWDCIEAAAGERGRPGVRL